MKIIGHRGAKGLAPENTLASFAKALEHNVDEIECDARVTRDGIVILEHDDWMHDAAGNRLHVSNYDYAELLTHKTDIATLAQSIEFLNKKVPLQIEVKERLQLSPIIAVVQEYLDKGWKTTDFILSSQNFKVLTALHQALPEVATCVIEPWSGVRAGYHARKLGTKRISMDQRWLWRGFIIPVTKRGWLLSPYTVNDVKQAKKWEKYGLYAICTDFPNDFDD